MTRDGIPAFTLYLTGYRDNDAAVLRSLADRPLHTILFKLLYTPPNRAFEGIRELQTAMRFRPFQDEPRRDCVLVLDLSEWLGHEGEEHLHRFLKYLHDCNGAERSFFRLREVLVTAGACERRAARRLYWQLSSYLTGGSVREEHPARLAKQLMEQYPMEDAVREGLAECLQNEAGSVAGLAQLHTILEDLFHRLSLPEGTLLTQTVLLNSRSVETSALGILLEEELAAWRQRHTREQEGTT